MITRTYGLDAIYWVAYEASDSAADACGYAENTNKRIQPSPAIDSLFWKSGGAVCPAGKSIWDYLPTLTNATYGLEALDTDLDKLLTGIIQGTGTALPANKSLYNILWVDRHAKDAGSFTFPSGDTTEKDISAISGGPDLTGTKMRRYWVKLDMTGPAGDAAAWTKCTIKIKEKIDASNYRTIGKAEKSRTNLGATAEPGVPIESLPTDVDLVITIQFDVGLTTTQTIYWRWVCEKMEY